MSRYHVVSINNSCPGQEGSRLARGEFNSGETAHTHAKQLVDKALRQLGITSTAHELTTRYGRWGSEVPMIYGEPRILFHASQYAGEKATSMFALGA